MLVAKREIMNLDNEQVGRLQSVVDIQDNNEYASKTNLKRIENLLQQGNSLFRVNRLDEALKLLEEAALMQKKYVSASIGKSRVLSGKLAAARTLNNVGVIYKRVNKTTKAMESYLESLSIRKEELGKDHIELVATLSNIGSIHVENREFDEAMSCFIDAKRIAILNLGTNHVMIANILNNIGYLTDLRGEYDEAIKNFESSLRIYIKAGFDDNDPVVEGTIRNIRQVLSRKKAEA